MYRKPELTCGPDDIVERIERPDPSARAVVGVFESEHCGALVGDLRARRGGGAHLLRGELPALARHAEHHESGVRRSAPVLVDHDMGVLLGDEDIAGPRLDLQRDLIRHRRRRHEDRLLLPEQVRDAGLELVDARVFALLLVADRRLRDRPTHALGRLRGGVGAKVDHARDATVRRVDIALLEQTLTDRGQPSYRARQVWEWTARGVSSYEEMTTLPKDLDRPSPSPSRSRRSSS